MNDKKLQTLEIEKSDKPLLPIFYNYILHNEMVPDDIDKKLFSYSKVTLKYMSRQRIEKPLSKILDLEHIYTDTVS